MKNTQYKSNWDKDRDQRNSCTLSNKYCGVSIKEEQLLTGCYQLQSLQEMGASEIEVEELLPKKMSKNNLDCTGTIEKKTYCSRTT